jgi:hypothetical protein
MPKKSHLGLYVVEKHIPALFESFLIRLGKQNPTRDGNSHAADRDYPIG